MAGWDGKEISVYSQQLVALLTELSKIWYAYVAHSVEIVMGPVEPL